MLSFFEYSIELGPFRETAKKMFNGRAIETKEVGKGPTIMKKKKERK